MGRRVVLIWFLSCVFGIYTVKKGIGDITGDMALGYILIGIPGCMFCAAATWVLFARPNPDRTQISLTKRQLCYGILASICFLLGAAAAQNAVKPQIEKTGHLQAAYEFGKRIYTE